MGVPRFLRVLINSGEGQINLKKYIHSPRFAQSKWAGYKKFIAYMWLLSPHIYITHQAHCVCAFRNTCWLWYIFWFCCHSQPTTTSHSSPPQLTTERDVNCVDSLPDVAFNLTVENQWNEFNLKNPLQLCVSNMHCRIPKMSTGSNGYTSCDKVGQWPTEDDTEIPSRVSGYERLHNGRFNKVSVGHEQRKWQWFVICSQQWDQLLPST